MDKSNIYPTFESLCLHRRDIQSEIQQIQQGIATRVANLIASPSPASTESAWVDRWVTRITLTLRIAKGVMAIFRAFRK